MAPLLLLIISLTHAAPSPMPPAGAEAYFPYEHGDRFVYATYYAGRKGGDKVWSSTAVWEEVVAEDAAHGFTVFVLQSSRASFNPKTKKFGPPDAVIKEDVFVLSSDGVAVLQTYFIPEGSLQDYADKRAAVLNELRTLKREEFTEKFRYWILPFPLKAGAMRETAGISYKILKSGAKDFIPPAKRKTTVGAAGYVGKKWAMTRWFEKDTGLLVLEEENKDAGVDAEKYPLKVRSLLKAYKSGGE